MADWEFIGQGGVANIASLQSYEHAIPEGAMLKVRLDLRTPVSQSIVSEVKRQMIVRGVSDANATASGNTMWITARKGFPWLAVIAAIILAIVALVIIIVSWSIFKKIVPAGLQGSLGILLIVGAVILAIGIGGEKIKRSIS